MPNANARLAGLLVFIATTIAASHGNAAPKQADAQKPAEAATRGLREIKDITFGDWQKLCFKAGGAPTLCRTSITGKFQTGQMAVRVDLIEREDAPAARLQLFVPVGMYLQHPAKLIIDNGSAFQVPYTWCLTNMCVAADVAPPEIIKQMETGKTLALQFVDANLLTSTVSMPLAQFGQVHKGAPAKTLEQQIDE